MLTSQHHLHPHGDMNTNSTSPIPIASKIFQLASGFRSAQRNACIDSKRETQCLKAKLRTVTMQRDTCARYALSLEGNFDYEQHHEVVTAYKAAEHHLVAANEENAELRVLLATHEATIKEQQSAFEELQAIEKTNRQALLSLRGKRGADKRIVEAWACKASNLSETCQGLEDTADQLQKENLRLQSALEELNATILSKDQNTAMLKDKAIEAEERGKRHEADAKKQQEQLAGFKKEFTQQKNVNRTLSDILEKKDKSWEDRQETFTREVNFAQAETRNNHENWRMTLESKNREISTLNEVIEAVMANINVQSVVRKILLINKGLRCDKIKRDQINKDMKTDIQNLLDTKQQESMKLTSYLQETKSLRAERDRAVDEAVQLKSQLERRDSFIKKLQKIITAQVGSDEVHGEARSIPEATVKTMMADAISEYFVEIEKLRRSLQNKDDKHQELEAKFTKCEDELFKHRVEEQFRQAEVERLNNLTSSIEVEKNIFANQVQQRDRIIYASLNPTVPNLINLQRYLATQIHPLQVQNYQLSIENRLGKEKFEQTKNYLECEVARLERMCGNLKNYYGQLEAMYWDLAVQQNDELHNELAKYKAKCGETHYFVSRPSSTLVHERRLLHCALLYGREGLDRRLLPPEYVDPKFLRGLHPASELALRKLWPDLWQIHHGQAAWIQPTVPLLTDAGEIIMDEGTRTASNKRLEAFKKELAVLDEALENRQRQIFDMDYVLDNDGTSSAPEDQDDGDFSSSGDGSIDSDEATNGSSSPLSSRTENTSPTPSDSASPESDEENSILGNSDDSELTYSNTVSQIMTREDYDSLPAFAKMKAARLGAQAEEDKRMAAHNAHDDTQEEAFLAQFGIGIEGLGDIDQEDEESVLPTYAHEHTPSDNGQAMRESHSSTVEPSDNEENDSLDYEDGEWNTCSRFEFENFDDEQKRRYMQIMAIERAEE